MEEEGDGAGFVQAEAEKKLTKSATDPKKGARGCAHRGMEELGWTNGYAGFMPRQNVETLQDVA